MMPTTVFFLGGYDLEMVTVRDLLCAENATVCDQQLRWGVRASAYQTEITAAIADGKTCVLIELLDDLPTDFPRSQLGWIDHHNQLAGETKPTALEQVFQYLKLPAERWTRDYALVAANDRGHLAALAAAGASTEEMRAIRERDRRAQGVTPEHDAVAREAANALTLHHAGRLHVAELPHTHTSSLADALDSRLGGPGYENLLVFTPQQTIFFGSGRIIQLLNRAHPGGWYGGEMPTRGYWGFPAPLDADNLITTIGTVLMTQPAKAIAVKKYRNILVWPLLLRGEPRTHEKLPLAQRWANHFQANGWQIDFPRPKQPTTQGGVEVYQVPNGFSYEEIVYFHPFVRDFLYGDGATKPEDRAVHRLSHTTVKRARITFQSYRFSPQEETVTLELNVDRVEIYICKQNVALFVVEVSSPKRVRDKVVTEEEINLEAIQDFQDQFRRIYPPFWYHPSQSPAPDSATSPGLCPTAVEWYGSSNDHALCAHNCTAPAYQFREFTRDGGEPPVFDHWQYFFNGIEPLRTRHQLDNNELCFQQIMDERIPAMSYIGVDDPHELTEGDMDRLTFFDAAGTDEYPYQKAFLDSRRSGHTYDRFWDYGTRYLLSGYGFTVLGKVNDYFFGRIVEGHFQTHYLRLGLLVHFQDQYSGDV